MELLLRMYRRLAGDVKIEAIEAADAVWAILERGLPGKERLLLCAYEFEQAGHTRRVTGLLSGRIGMDDLDDLEAFCADVDRHDGAIEALGQHREGVAALRREKAAKKLHEAEEKGRQEGIAEGREEAAKSVSAPEPDSSIPPLSEAVIAGIAARQTRKHDLFGRIRPVPTVARLEALLVMIEAWEMPAGMAGRLLGLGERGAVDLVGAINAKFGFQGADVGARIRKGRLPDHWNEALSEVIEGWRGSAAA